MDAKQDAETGPLGRTFIRDANEANAFSKLSRYEATSEHSLSSEASTKLCTNCSTSKPPAALMATLHCPWR